MLKAYIWGCFLWIFVVGALLSNSDASTSQSTVVSPLPPELLVHSEKDSWNKRYASRSGYIYGKSPAKFLSSNYDFIPQSSSVLDIGMGEGRNAVFLASKGHSVTGLDISSIAIKKAKLLAREFGVRIKAVEADVSKYTFPTASFDAIILFYYLNRDQVEKVLTWLKPGGVLIVENFTVKQNEVKGSEKINPEYLLREQELPKLFKGVRILKYEEPIHRAPFTASAIFQKMENNKANL